MLFEPYRYIKAESSSERPPKDSFFWDQLLPLGFIFTGSLIISSQTLLPFVSFPAQNSFLVRPVKTFQVLGASYKDNKVAKEEEEVARVEAPIPSTFFLSIPKLGIDAAKVRKDTTEEDPAEFLGHLLGSALPGDNGGAIFVYGHSTFPWLFNNNNYRTIFSTLPGLEKDDRIFIEYPGKRWEYRVDGFKTSDPEEVKPFLFGNKEGLPARLVLMTCVPPGTRLRRFLVFASLLGVEDTTEL